MGAILGGTMRSPFTGIIFMLELTHDVNMLLPLLIAVVYRMAETGYTRLPVVEHGNPRKVVGMITLSDLLMARKRNLEEEQHRERALRIRVLFRSPVTEKVKI